MVDVCPGLSIALSHPLSHALRAVGAKISPRLDGYDFELDGVAGSFILGDEPYDSQEGPFTICRVSVPRDGPTFVMLAAVKEVRRTRRQIAGANVGLVMLAVIVAATLYELCAGG